MWWLNYNVNCNKWAQVLTLKHHFIKFCIHCKTYYLSTWNHRLYCCNFHPSFTSLYFMKWQHFFQCFILCNFNNEGLARVIFYPIILWYLRCTQQHVEKIARMIAFIFDKSWSWVKCWFHWFSAKRNNGGGWKPLTFYTTIQWNLPNDVSSLHRL